MESNVKMRVGSAKDGGHASELRVLGAMAAVFAALLLIGTFFDETLAKALYSPHNVIATIVTTLGIYPFTAGIVLFLGVICQRVMQTVSNKVGKYVLAAITVAFALFVGFVGSRSLLDGDCLGGIVPSLNGNNIASIVLSLVIEYPLILVGWRLASRSDDKLMLKKSLCLIVVLIAAFAFLQLTKGIFNRPRYRVVAEGLDGVSFVPWYTISPKPTELMEAHGLAANEFRSFPSGHAIMSTATMSILLSLTWLFPQLRNKRVQLCVAGFVFALVVMFTRMVLGAHFISDVSAGGLIGLAFVFAYEVVQGRLLASR